MSTTLSERRIRNNRIRRRRELRRHFLIFILTRLPSKYYESSGVFDYCFSTLPTLVP